MNYLAIQTLKVLSKKRLRDIFESSAERKFEVASIEFEAARRVKEQIDTPFDQAMEKAKALRAKGKVASKEMKDEARRKAAEKRQKADQLEMRSPNGRFTPISHIMAKYRVF